jgi:hypothetical protein
VTTFLIAPSLNLIIPLIIYQRTTSKDSVHLYQCKQAGKTISAIYSRPQPLSWLKKMTFSNNSVYWDMWPVQWSILHCQYPHNSVVIIHQETQIYSMTKVDQCLHQIYIFGLKRAKELFWKPRFWAEADLPFAFKRSQNV